MLTFITTPARVVSDALGQRPSLSIIQRDKLVS